ncbi:MAG: acyltransferase [Acidobacteriota bacterium]
MPIGNVPQAKTLTGRLINFLGYYLWLDLRARGIASFYRLFFNHIGKGTRIVALMTVSGPENIEIGERVSLNHGILIHGRGGVSIGDDTIIAHNVSILSNQHSIESLDVPVYANKMEFAKVSIGKRVWVGCNVVILPGVSIGDDAVIGAGAVVTKNVPERAIAAGVPARILRYRS